MNPVVLSPLTHRLLTVLVFLLIPIAILAPHGVVWEVVIGGTIGLYHSRQKPLQELSYPLIATLFAFPLWGLVTALWADAPLAALLMGTKVFTLVLLGIFWCRLSISLPEKVQKSLIRALIGGLFLGLIFLVIDENLGHPWQLFWHKNSAKAYAQGALILSLVTWPSMLWALQRPYALWIRVGLGTLIVLSILLVLLQIDCDSSFIGLFFGLSLFISTLIFPHLTSGTIRLLVPIFMLVFPFIALHVFKPESIPTFNTYVHSPSYIHRLHIWNEVASSIFEHPWQGIGMDGTAKHTKRDQITKWPYVDAKGKQQLFQTESFTMHPHNAILQLWLELGFVGLILGVILTHLLLLQIYCTSLKLLERAVCAGLFGGVFVIVWVNLGFWQNWWISGLWMSVGLTAMLCQKREGSHEDNLS